MKCVSRVIWALSTPICSLTISMTLVSISSMSLSTFLKPEKWGVHSPNIEPDARSAAPRGERLYEPRPSLQLTLVP